MSTKLTGASAALLSLALASAAFAIPPLYTWVDAWNDTLRKAESDLAICKQRGIAAGVFGAIEVRFDPRRRSITTSSSRSLGKHGAELGRCVRDALAKHPRDSPQTPSYADIIESQVSLGKPVVVLRPPAQLIPLWREALDGGPREHAALRERLPPDYTFTTHGCLDTKWSALRAVEELWLPGVGPRVDPNWNQLLSAKLGRPYDGAVWHASGALVVRSISQSARGLCLVPFDRARQASLHRELEALGTCWVGGLTEILARPRVAFPADRKYTSISVYDGRACAIDTAGKLTCCGKVEPALPPAPRALASISLGGGYACGLAASGEPSCWGKIPKPPPGKLVKLATGYQHACGLRPGGEVVCWGRGHELSGFEVSTPPPGPFTDVATPRLGACGLRPDGRVECWGHAYLERNPPGAYRSLATSSRLSCAIRSDLTAGCWGSPGQPVEIAQPERYQQVVAHEPGACARRHDDTVACWRRAPPTRPHRAPPAPTTRFTAIAGDYEQYCGIRHDGRIECWGDVWPSLYDDEWRSSSLRWAFGPAPDFVEYRDPIALSGRVLDEWGWPIAGAEVLAASDVECLSDLDPFGPRASSSAIGAQRWDRDSFAVATTDDAGRWRSSITYLPRGREQGVCIVATAPGRERVTHRPGPRRARMTVVDQVLRPTSTIDVVPMCGAARCTGSFAIEVEPRRELAGARLEHVPPGTYTLGVRMNPGTPSERHGRAVVDVTFTPTHRSVAVEMLPAQR